MQQMGVKFEEGDDRLRVWGDGRLKAVDVNALPYPGLPTDMQPQLMALLIAADGVSMVSDMVYPERFDHVGELSRLGADITRQTYQAIIRGPSRLTGAPVKAGDLRGGAGLILAGLAAEGATEVENIQHVDRGYELIEERLAALGADIARVGSTPLAEGQTELFPRRAAG
jgi:UDP-N-acetylglucosamine 1-carboxyvinyltransferase